MKEESVILRLMTVLGNCDLMPFPSKGRVHCTDQKGVYIIYDFQKCVLHVGNTPRGQSGLNGRLNNHLDGKSSFARGYLKPNNINLREEYFFRYLEIEDARQRALVEALAIGTFCPKHLGTGEKK